MDVEGDKYGKHQKQIKSTRKIQVLVVTLMVAAFLYSTMPYHNSSPTASSVETVTFSSELDELALKDASKTDDRDNLVADDEEINMDEHDEDTGLHLGYPKYEANSGSSNEVSEDEEMVFANDVLEKEETSLAEDPDADESNEHDYDAENNDDLFIDQAEFENAPIIKVLPESKVRKYSPIVLAHERYYRNNPSKLYVPTLKKNSEISKEQFLKTFMDKSQPVIIPFEAMRHLGFFTKPGWTLEELKELYPNSKKALYKYGAVLKKDIDIGPGVSSLMENKRLRKTSVGKSYPRNTQFKLESLRHLHLQRPAVVPDDFQMMLPSLWFASTSEATPLHSDCCDNWAMMITGTKKWFLAPPSEARVLSPNCKGGLCWVKKLPHADEHAKAGPEARLRDNAQIIEVDVPAGNVLFLPAGWFHHVEQTEPTVMVNFWSKNGPQFLKYYKSLKL